MLLALQLGASFLTEFICSVLGSAGIPNHWVINAYFPIEFTGLFLLAMRELNVRHAAPLTALATTAYLTAMTVEARMGNGFHTLLTTTYIVGGFVLAVMYTALLFRTADEVFHPLHQDPRFWWCLALVVWFTSCIPLNGLLIYLLERDAQLADRLFSINEVLCLVRYALVSAGCLLYLPHLRRI